MAVLTIAAPRLEIEVPEGWAVGSSPDAWGVVHGAPVNGFTPNIVLNQEHVSAELTLRQLVEVATQQLRESYGEVVVQQTSDDGDLVKVPTSIDRVITFVVGGHQLIQYQRLMLIPGTSGRQWYAHVEATYPVSSRAELHPVIAAALSSLSLYPPA
jgi:hypothetical protein